MKKRILYTVYQIWDDALQPERNPLLAVLRESKTERENLSNLVNFTFFKIFVNKAVSDAVYRLRIDADDLLTHVPIAHFIPHHRSVYTLKASSFFAECK